MDVDCSQYEEMVRLEAARNQVILSLDLVRQAPTILKLVIHDRSKRVSPN